MFKLYRTQSLRIWTQTTPKRNRLKNLAGHSGTHAISALENPAEARGQLHTWDQLALQSKH